MTRSIRPLTGGDNREARRLAWEAFGFPSTARRGPAGQDDRTAAEQNQHSQGQGAHEDLYTGSRLADKDWPGPGFHIVAAFDGAQLQGQVMAREFHTWSQGRRIPTCGVAGVTIAAEHRGEGLMTPLLKGLLTDAHHRGDAIATLYATAPGIYQRFGFETVTSAATVTVPTTAAAAVRRGAPVHLQRARAVDVPALRRCYRQWAHARTGALDRVPPSFQRTDEQFLGLYDAITMAVAGDGTCLGYACWDRGPTGSDVINVQEFIAGNEAAYRALWRMLGSFSSVASRIELRTCTAEPARVFLPTSHWAVSEEEPYMLRVLDVCAALSLRRAAGDLSVTFAVVGDECGLIDGTYRVDSADGTIACTPATASGAEPVLTPRGLSALYAGTMTAADLHSTGHLQGGTQTDWACLDRLLVREPWQVHDEF